MGGPAGKNAVDGWPLGRQADLACGSPSIRRAIRRLHGASLGRHRHPAHHRIPGPMRSVVVVTGIKASLQQRHRHQARQRRPGRRHLGRRYRQAAGQERRRRAAAHPGVNTESAASGEGGFDENDRVSHPRHLAQPDPGHDRRPQHRHRRLVHPRPVPDGRPQRQLQPAAGGNGRHRRASTRPRTPPCSKAASPASSTCITRKPLDLGRPVHRRGVGRGAYNSLTRDDQAAGQRPARLEERRRHLRHHRAGLLRRPHVRRYGQETWATRRSPRPCRSARPTQS